MKLLPTMNKYSQTAANRLNSREKVTQASDLTKVTQKGNTQLTRATLYPFYAIFVSLLLTGCMAMEMNSEADFLEVGEVTHLLSVDDFKDYYCDYYHKAVYCGVEQSGRTVIKNRSKDIWIYVNSLSGNVQLELAERIDGTWVTTHTETAEPGFVARAYTFEEPAMRRARVIKANGEVYHVAVLAD